MWQEILDLALNNGLWAVLFLALLIYQLKDSKLRETKYQETISELNKTLNKVNRIDENVTILNENIVVVKDNMAKIEESVDKIMSIDKQLDRQLDKKLNKRIDKQLNNQIEKIKDMESTDEKE